MTSGWRLEHTTVAIRLVSAMNGVPGGGYNERQQARERTKGMVELLVTGISERHGGDDHHRGACRLVPMSDSKRVTREGLAAALTVAGDDGSKGCRFEPTEPGDIDHHGPEFADAIFDALPADPPASADVDAAQLSEPSVALLLEHSRYKGCVYSSLTMREHLVRIEAAIRAESKSDERLTRAAIFQAGLAQGRAEARTLDACGGYDVHDWNNNASPSYCYRCHVYFPRWNAGRAAYARLAEADR